MTVPIVGNGPDRAGKAGRAGRRPPAGCPPRSPVLTLRRLVLLRRLLLRRGAAESRRRAPLPLRRRRIRRRRRRTRPAHALAIAIGHVARLRQLLAIGHDDAHVMLGVLQIVLCKHRIAGRLRIAGERKILLRDMRRRAPDFHIRSVEFEAARQRIVVFPIVITGRDRGDFVVPASLPKWLLCYFNLSHQCPSRSREHGPPGVRARLGRVPVIRPRHGPSIATPSERADPGAPWRRNPRAGHGLSRGNRPSVFLLGDQWC